MLSKRVAQQSNFRSPAGPTQPQRRSLCSVNDNGAGGRPWFVGSARLVRPERGTGLATPATAAPGWRPFRDNLGVVGLGQQPASYYRAAAARARRLRAEATTRRLKEHLGEEVARYERLAEEIERASEPGSDFAPRRNGSRLQKQNPRPIVEGFGVARKNEPAVQVKASAR